MALLIGSTCGSRTEGLASLREGPGRPQAIGRAVGFVLPWSLGPTLLNWCLFGMMSQVPRMVPSGATMEKEAADPGGLQGLSLWGHVAHFHPPQAGGGVSLFGRKQPPFSAAGVGGVREGLLQGVQGQLEPWSQCQRQTVPSQHCLRNMKAGRSWETPARTAQRAWHSGAFPCMEAWGRLIKVN